MADPNQGREETDESLRAERGKTDRELTRRRAVAERSADAVVVQARDAADEVLQAARDTADDKMQERTPAVAEERTLADDALETERTNADKSVRREREERRHALSSLLGLEREETDQHLLIERGRSDEALNTRDIFLAMVSHDLRTMLGGIAMTAELLARDAPEAGSKVAARAETIQRFTTRMNRLIGDLVDVASIEAGKLNVAPTRGDLRAIIRESVEVFHASAEAHGMRLGAETEGPPVPALFDQERILQVLANLIGNSIKFSPAGTRISIGLTCAGGEARVSVTDTGPGIPAAHVEAIFGKFWQVGRRDRRGLGLGLYISRCIIDAHGGRIWAESGRPAGCMLTFALPA